MMAESVDMKSPLPPGWEARYDHRTGRHYYLNHFTKTTSWEDPRMRYKQLQGPLNAIMPECAPIQATHGSPYHVYPANNSFYPVQAAFQAPADGSPIIAPKLISLSARSTPPPGVRPGSSLAQRLQEAALLSASETELSVGRIQAMFPTASDTHIRILLKKYHGREAVVISALQVEKHPISTPGPTALFSTPPARLRGNSGLFQNTAIGIISALQMTPPLGRDTSRSGSPIVGRFGSPITRASSGNSTTMYGSPRIGDGYRSTPKPHSSPKMKLRYLKSVFPKADETLLLDILANADNNVQSASEKLLSMGYDKKISLAINKTSIQIAKEKKEAEIAKENKSRNKDGSRVPPKTPPPKMRSKEEKGKIKARLQTQYTNVADRILSMALDSVDYNEELASQILNIMVQQDTSRLEEQTRRDSQDTCKSEESTKSGESSLKTDEHHVATEKSADRNSLKIAPGADVKIVERETFETYAKPKVGGKAPESPKTPETPDKIDGRTHQQSRRPKAKSENVKSPVESLSDTELYKSAQACQANGPNAALCKGPNNDLLLPDYETWNGPDPAMRRGPNPALAAGTRGAVGPNAALRKGPQPGLHKGSSAFSRSVQQKLLACHTRCN